MKDDWCDTALAAQLCALSEVLQLPPYIPNNLMPAAASWKHFAVSCSGAGVLVAESLQPQSDGRGCSWGYGFISNFTWSYPSRLGLLQVSHSAGLRCMSFLARASYFHLHCCWLPSSLLYMGCRNQSKRNYSKKGEKERANSRTLMQTKFINKGAVGKVHSN